MLITLRMPRCSRAVFLLALVCPLLGGAPPAAAIQQFEKRKAALDPSDAKAVMELAAWCFSVGLDEDGKELCQGLLEKDPDHKGARKALGYVRVGEAWLTTQEKRRQEHVAKIQAEVAKLNDNDAAGVFKLAIKASSLELDELAKTLYLNVVSLDPDHAGARRKLGQTQFQGAWKPDTELLADYVSTDSEEHRQAIREAFSRAVAEFTPDLLEKHRVWAAAPKGLQKQLPLKGASYETYYHLSVPEAYTGLTRVPLVVFLHGGGVGKGDPDDIIGLNQHTDPKGWILACPRVPNRDQHGTRFWIQPEAEACVLDLIRTLTERYAIDPRAIYLTGGSAGGWGTLHIGARHLDLFAALGADCPEASGADVQKLSKIPLFIRHGSEDHVCEVERVRALHAQLKRLGAVHKYLEIPGAGHTLPVESSGAAFDWIASFQRPAPPAKKP